MKRETFRIPGTDVVLGNVHSKRKCLGETCVIHNPSNHHMRSWPLIWRDDRGIFERLCGHGIGHPDPDQHGYWRVLDIEHEGIHGCDGCCWGGASVPAVEDIDGPSEGGKALLGLPDRVTGLEPAEVV